MWNETFVKVFWRLHLLDALVQPKYRPCPKESKMCTFAAGMFLVIALL
jgi:hypothetical protein